MAATQNPVLANLHDRLERLEKRIAEIRSSSTIDHTDFEGDLSNFADRHMSIRSQLDETTAESALSKADQETSNLEAGIESWFHSIDEKFANAPRRVNSVSM